MTVFRGPTLRHAVWGDIRGRLNGDNWSSLDLDKRIELTLVVFSIATIVDDQRILRAAIAEVPNLSAEFGDVLVTVSPIPTKLRTIPQTASSINGPNSVSRLRSLATVRGRAAPPVVGALSDIKEAVRKLIDIEPEGKRALLPAAIRAPAVACERVPWRVGARRGFLMAPRSRTRKITGHVGTHAEIAVVRSASRRDRSHK